jgi:lipopolysaccharide export LptBFGC system permease protein LptF
MDRSRLGSAEGLALGMPSGVPAQRVHGHRRPQRFAIDPPQAFSRRETSLAEGTDLPDQMSLADLGEQLVSLEGSGYDTTRLRVAYFAKLAHPLTPFVMLLLGLPFGFKVGRSGSLYAVGVSLALVIVYWATLAVFNALGLETILPPLLAAWAPNVVYGLVGLYLLLYIKT